ncbi:MAG: immunoglobulin domain-containing protein, partial [Candidatus Hydrogenedentes bacterium]|nr:immunoglobulin domain-containing protein [Candidatus Hydrogenedentota bacterium]
MRNLLLFAVAWTLSVAVVSPVAQAADVDFDYHIYVAEEFLGNVLPLRGQDNDGNGILEQDQLGLLRTILAGGTPVACLDAGRVSAIQSAYTQNKSRARTELTVTASGQTVDILDALQDQDAVLSAAVENLLTGFLTIADTSTLVFINNLADTVVAQYLAGTQLENQTATIQNQINFTAGEYLTYGNAPSEPDYLGPAGDLDIDGTTNLAEYTAASGNREAWLASNCITSPLRVNELASGGVALTGASKTFFVSAAGGTGSYTYQWRKGTPSSSTLLASSDTYSIPFLNESHEGTYFAVINDGQTTLNSPGVSLNVVFLALTISRPIQGGTRTAGSSFTFTVEAIGGSPGPYVYTWRRNGNVVGGNTSTLVLNNLTSNDAGSYTVSVTSNGGADAKTSGPVTLNVTTPAVSITQQPQGATKTAGESHTFTVAATGGSGSYNYDWQKGGNTLGAPNQPTLTLSNLQVNNSGNYRVVVSDANNAALKATSSVAVLTVVLPTIEITQQPVGAVRNLDESYTFTVAASGGSGTFNYDWQRNGESLGAPSAASLVLQNLRSTDSGFYRVVVSDAAVPAATVTSDSVELVVNYNPIIID